MEVGDSATNSFLIDVSSIKFGIYRPPDNALHIFSSSASEIENTLRTDKFLVCCDSSRLFLWVFSVANLFDPSQSKSIFNKTISACGLSLSLVTEGEAEPASLLKGRLASWQSMVDNATNPSFLLPDLSGRAHLRTLITTPKAINASRSGPATSTEPMIPGTTPLKGAHEHFILAVTSTVMLAFCQKLGAIPLNYRTALWNTHTEANTLTPNDPSILASFCAYLTTAGTLIVSLSLVLCEATSLIDEVTRSNPSLKGADVLAAPMGFFAKYVGSDGDSQAVEAGSISTPRSSVFRLRHDSEVRLSRWRETCSRLLYQRGIPLPSLSNCSWTTLRVSRGRVQEQQIRETHMQDPIIISWPEFLCFHKKCFQAQTTNGSDGNDLVEEEETSDPLASAMIWYNSISERNEKTSTRKKHREAIITQEEKEAAPDSTILSFAPRRPSNTAAGSMYPTPPDGVQNSLLGGITPSGEGNVCSPHNPEQLGSVAEHNLPFMSGTSIEDLSGPWTRSDSKRGPADGHYAGQTDVLGVSEGDMFGNADITDADFNFFDEQHGEVDIAGVGARELGATDFLSPPLLDDIRPRALDIGRGMMEVGVKTDSRDTNHLKPEVEQVRITVNSVPEAGDDHLQPTAPKRGAYPFDSFTVFKRVRAAKDPRPLSVPDDKRPRRGSVFEKIEFDSCIPVSSRKYEHGGYFGYNEEAVAANSRIDKTQAWNSLPSARPYVRNSEAQDLPEITLALIKRLTASTAVGHAELAEGRAEVASSQGNSAEEYEGDELPSRNEAEASGRVYSLDADVISQPASGQDFDLVESIDTTMAQELQRLTRLDPMEMSLINYFTDPQPMVLQLTLRDKDYIAVAQILTEQAAFGSLDLPFSGVSAPTALLSPTRRRQLGLLLQKALVSLKSSIPPSLGTASSCSFRTLLNTQDGPMIGQSSRIQPRPVPGRDILDQARIGNLYPISCHRLQLRRNDSALSVLPSAMTFWESLGLGPANGAKDVVAVCVHPASTGMSENVDTFLIRIRRVYESLKLGAVDRLSISVDQPAGLLPYSASGMPIASQHANGGNEYTLKDRMEQLRQIISKLTTHDVNIVIIFVYSPKNPASVLECCAAFQRLDQMVRQDLCNRSPSFNLENILQLVSEASLVSPTSLVIPAPSELHRLCLSIYDRCALFNSDALSTPCILLERPLPRLLDFRLTAEPPESLMHENACINVAYAQSIDERWITAAWTDSSGSQQTTAAYCLGRRGKPLATSQPEVAKAMWDTTHDMMSLWKVNWRVIITKCGVMSTQEIQTWISLSIADSKVSVSLTLLSVNTNPSLQLIVPHKTIPPLSTPYTTEANSVSTLQTPILSPGQDGSFGPPPKDAQASPMTTSNIAAELPNVAVDSESDTVLIDLGHQTWGAILSHRLSCATSLLDHKPALVSGYLVQRTSAMVEDPPALMEINVVHTDTHLRAHEQLLREVLNEFRGLATLARARGMVRDGADLRPWHVVAAEKGVRALYLYM